jgi:hypothetical protein
VLCEEGVFDTLLAIAIQDPEKRAVNREAWVALAAYNKELQKPLNNPLNAAERLTKSILVQDKGVALVESITAAVGEELATLYMHHSMTHILDMVHDNPVDISNLSQQYIEHALKQGKADMHNFTNKKLKDENQQVGRNQQVMAKDRERRKLQKEMPMPLSRNEKQQLGDGSKGAE